MSWRAMIQTPLVAAVLNDGAQYGWVRFPARKIMTDYMELLKMLVICPVIQRHMAVFGCRRIWRLNSLKMLPSALL